VTVEANRAAEQAARSSYGRLLALLARHGMPIGTAEEVLADAFCAALASWPREGVPERPDAWLFTAAKRKYLSQHRRDRVRAQAEPTLRQLLDQQGETAPTTFGDDRLKLLFVCAHPAIDPAMHAPLMLQTVLGLDAAKIAAAFVISAEAMAQRLVRAKIKIRDAGIPFAIPDASELASRARAVLDAIYAAYGSAWEDVAGVEAHMSAASEEAIWLAHLLVELLPAEPEAKGLLALLLHCEARRAARRAAGGSFIPLAEQDTALWSRAQIGAAERLLYQAATLNRMGRYQLEAAIQSAHTTGAWRGNIDWNAITLLYQGLLQLAPSLGALVGHAAAVAQAHGAETAWAALLQISEGDVTRYQPYWALRAHLLASLGRNDEARAAYARAAALTKDPAVRSFLLGRRPSQGCA
jgi:RNA polymerase sigma-70 factor (ECF subfamily)